MSERYGNPSWIDFDEISARVSMLEQKTAALEACRKDAWIPVSERLPDCAGRYMCWFQENHAYLYYVAPHGWHWEDEDVMSKRHQSQVTHWMPLPAAPGNEREGKE